MINVKKIASSVIVFTLILSTIFSLFIPASAATYGSGTRTGTITVTTKANYWVPGSESITLSQTKGTCRLEKYNFFTGKTKVKTSKAYGEWDIVARSTDGGHTVKATLRNGSVKLKLKPNKTYKISVSWDHTAATLTSLSKGNYTSYPSWRVSGTWKVSSYY